MHAFKPIDYANRDAFYRELLGEIQGMLEKTWYTNLANASAALMAHLPRINWVGFYLMSGGELVLGPFQGLPACLRIPLGKGVCGTAAATRKSVLVEDVHAFPGHIACDARSRSEIVIPLLHEGKLIGVLDVDSPELARFNDSDRQGLERIAVLLARESSWRTPEIGA